jgi:hypothetical protein
VNDTRLSSQIASPALVRQRWATRWRWGQLTEAERADWRRWRIGHPSAAWDQLGRTILLHGFRHPPTEAEARILWPIVDARPNDAAIWFRTGAALSIGWRAILRLISTSWRTFRHSIPRDQRRSARADHAEAVAVLRRLGWSSG